MKKRAIICLAVALLAAVASAPAVAQSEAPGPSAQELRQQLTELQAQMKKVLSRLDELEGAKASAAMR